MSIRRIALALAVALPLAACEPACAPNVPGPAPTTLRRVHIETVGGAPVVNTQDYVDATIWVVTPNGTEEVRLPTRVRGRGNSTWALPKKPYRLRLDEAVSLAGMPADRDWALLANYLDTALVRNRLAMDLGEDVGLDYNPRSEFVELYFNGAYQGVYELYEHLEVAPEKIDVVRLDPDADVGADLITGGYHLEVDHRLDEDVCWSTARNVPICSKDPEFDPQAVTDPDHPSHPQFEYITDYVDRAEAAINAPGDGYEEFFDVDAMIGWYLVSELMKNADSRIVAADGAGGDLTSSVHLHKDRGGKLVFGPLWDFDLSAGNPDYNGLDNPRGWWIRSSDWFGPLFAHSSFGHRVLTKWCELRTAGTIDAIPARIEALVAELGSVAIDGNFERWPGRLAGTTHSGEVGELTTWLTTRVDWMHAELTSEFGACPSS